MHGTTQVVVDHHPERHSACAALVLCFFLFFPMVVGIQELCNLCEERLREGAKEEHSSAFVKFRSSQLQL